MNRFKTLTEAALAAQKGDTRAHQIFAPRPGNPPASAMVAGRELVGANKTEAAYGTELQRRFVAGEIAEWWWQPFSLRLCFMKGAVGDYYRPDFMVQLMDGSLQIHETKGFMQDDARTKLKMAAAIYPFRFILVKRDRGAWAYTPFLASLP